jgi:hypothetical protein
MNSDAPNATLQNATAALVGVVVGYLAHGHWPLVESLVRLLMG